MALHEGEARLKEPVSAMVKVHKYQSIYSCRVMWLRRGQGKGALVMGKAKQGTWSQAWSTPSQSTPHADSAGEEGPFAWMSAAVPGSQGLAAPSSEPHP